ncbi:MAG TPA: hypothetical protein VJL08_03810 [Dehalococcoidia bacterium]|nr:hypothetical protein [Dehalococcoidia bacterium]
MRTHVFIVNDTTFPSHLRYLFAGTTAGEREEWMGLLADINRVRPGDLVVFYIEATTTVKGGFYGVFQIADTSPVVFQVSGLAAREPDLGRRLIYRTLLEPCEVYEQGIPEWEALDKLPVYSTEIQWSLIYRKLRGKRGCTPLLPWEGRSLIDMIRNKNSGNRIADRSSTCGFDWDPQRRVIITTNSRSAYPYARAFSTDLVAAISDLQRRRRAFEVHLQAYLTSTVGITPELGPIVGHHVEWFGNEVACGVGMQKIDILTLCDDGKRREYRLIELKHKPVEPPVVNQVEHYVNWASQDACRHLERAFAWNLQPVVVAPARRIRNWRSVFDAFNGYNRKGISLPIMYAEFRVERGTVEIQIVNY